MANSHLTLLCAALSIPQLLAVWALPNTAADLFFFCVFGAGPRRRHSRCRRHAVGIAAPTEHQLTRDASHIKDVDHQDQQRHADRHKIASPA